MSETPEAPQADNPTLTKEQQAGLELLLHRTIQLICQKNGFSKTCLTCQQFNEGTEICAKWNARPPAKVIVAGCESHEPHPF